MTGYVGRYHTSNYPLIGFGGRSSEEGCLFLMSFNSSHLRIGRNPKRKDKRLPTTSFEGAMFVSFKEVYLVLFV